MKHLLLALTLIAAASCGDDDDSAPRYNDFKVELAGESDNNFICGIRYVNDTTELEHYKEVAVSYTLETVDVHGNVTRERIYSNEDRSKRVRYEEFKGKQTHHRIKDLTIHNAGANFTTQLEITACTYLPSGTTRVTSAPMVLVQNAITDKNYNVDAELSGEIIGVEKIWDGTQVVNGTPAQSISIAPWDGNVGGSLLDISLARDANLTYIEHTFALFENKFDTARDQHSYGGTIIVNPNIEAQ